MEDNPRVLNCPDPREGKLCTDECEEDPISLAPIPLDRLVRLKLNGALRCYDIEMLYQALSVDQERKEATSRTVFHSQAQLDRITALYRALPGNQDAPRLWAPEEKEEDDDDEDDVWEDVFDGVFARLEGEDDDEEDEDDPVDLDVLERMVELGLVRDIHHVRITSWDRDVRRRIRELTRLRFIDRRAYNLATIYSLEMVLNQWPSPRSFPPRALAFLEDADSLVVRIRGDNQPLPMRYRTLVALLQSIPYWIFTIRLDVQPMTPWTMELTDAILRGRRDRVYVDLVGLPMSDEIRQDLEARVARLRE